MTRVKVCGITNRSDLDTAVDAGVDAVGLIVDVDVQTPREISPQQAAELAAATPPFVTAVLVTMADVPDAATELVEAVRPDAVQVHGESTPDALASLGAAVEADVIKATDPGTAATYDGHADAVLVDSLDESGAGGTGTVHDWDRTGELVESLQSPVVLAGGLTPENVADAVEAAAPFAVDVASGVEAESGQKDADAVSAFVDAAGGCQ
ncbi:N-(5'-phosphoribosyl)anthranilate isomerase [Natronomonas pharaonis DSM 2160]|uniref:N-(5'-phosphoribosyl)anthranilate isomerase n=1 Tax=Natronomonas pharaonis (strain ATCC 35678 / DSM 2160 / CIP 103997 / JCM 8858 / NBRC 14720 / NCIMB 2260 / Gabara) TaxID=348780 RepID=TRPF_NATPD|nr:phosphoribosylanthranilate isomerase [Natronomonas pharaonis]Q3IQ37.1 RecName: Full=N-(5'-phosphoribosyl)anthranilate isomerase; Short=PRAI [Natronomonas pharaonis DSM 2160]CAI49761.1 N-(5'-phosphoribosyl)anthranilate isomerase [Natronomonas pharaonis DSM 2160]